MRHRVVDLYSRNAKMVFEDYDSIDEFIKITSGRELSPDFAEKGKSQRTEKLSKAWEGVSSFKEAQDLLKYGWESATFDKTLAKINKLERTKYVGVNRFNEDVCGFQPIIPNYLLGIPNQMINTHYEPKKLKILDVIVSLEASCFTSPEKILEYLDKVIAKIYQLERSGFRVNLKVMYAFSRGDLKSNGHVLTIQLKSEKQSLNLKKLMFPIGHAGMFRVISFDWYERVPDGKLIDGYGIPTSHFDKETINFILKNINAKRNTYLIFLNTNLDNLFKEVH